VGEVDVDGRASFGVATAYDLDAGGAAELRYSGPSSRVVWLIGQAALWALLLLAASRLAVPARLRLSRARDETLIDLDAEPGASLPPPAGRVFDDWVDELMVEESEEVAELEHFGGQRSEPLIVRPDPDGGAPSDPADVPPGRRP
jgi:hypothetical protein